MSENSRFSSDGKWWWSGAAWVPAQSPDGRSAIWNGSVWVLRGGSISVMAVTLIAIGLWVVEFVWAAVVVFILILQANAEYEARGRVGYESITNTSVSVPFLLSLLILPAIITILAAANIRRWWIGFVVGGWPVIALIVVAPGGSNLLEAAAIVGFIIAVLIATAWFLHRQTWGIWQLSADGQRWVRRGSSFSTLSSDGRWRWDGRTWLPAPEARSGGSA